MVQSNDQIRKHVKPSSMGKTIKDSRESKQENFAKKKKRGICKMEPYVRNKKHENY